MNAAKGVSSEIVLSASASCGSRRLKDTTAYPTASPTAIPPAPAIANWSAALPAEKVPDIVAFTAIRYATNAVASFTRLSPRNTVLSVRRIFSCRVKAIAATASGGEMIAPSTNAGAHASPTTAWVIAATARIVTNTKPTPSSRMGRRLI